MGILALLAFAERASEAIVKANPLLIRDTVRIDGKTLNIAINVSEKDASNVTPNSISGYDAVSIGFTILATVANLAMGNDAIVSHSFKINDDEAIVLTIDVKEL